VGAVCGKAARTVLCGGRSVMSVPTAIVVVFGERHLRHVLLSYMKYHNEIRTHLSLEKDAPVSRPVQLAGTVLCRPVLGGLHHQYVRI
jgi:hypothetical protein